MQTNQVNTRFGKLENGVFKFAPIDLIYDGNTYHKPHDSTYYDAGYKDAHDVMPSEPAPEGYHYRATDDYEYHEATDDFWRVYTTVEDSPAPVREFSKFDLEIACFHEGLLDALDAFVDSQVITNERGQTMPLRRAYQTALTFSSAHPLFEQYLAAAKTAMDVDDETAERILAAAEVSGR